MAQSGTERRGSGDYVNRPTSQARVVSRQKAVHPAYPLDGQLLGNEGNDHNFHFTAELHTSFRYKGGEAFHFQGDDDLWAFVDGQLALDLGGVHGEQEGSVDIDALGLEVDQIVPLDLFYAERHTSESVLRVRLERFDLCGP